MPWHTMPGGMQIKLTNAQWDAATTWAIRTFSREGPQHILDVFPERDNWANGQRRCCHKLIEKGLLQGTQAEGYTLESTLMQRLLQSI